jgi:hypothetical protein
MRRRLLVALVLGVVTLGVLVGVSVHDLLGRPSPSPTLAVSTIDVGGVVRAYEAGASHRDAQLVLRLAEMSTTYPIGVHSAAQWWRSTPTLIVAMATLVLLLATIAAAGRRGAYSAQVGRLLQLAGTLAMIGGPMAVLIAAGAPRWAHGNWIHTSLWPQALIWALLGGGLLATRELLARAAAMRSELDGVI